MKRIYLPALMFVLLLSSFAHAAQSRFEGEGFAPLAGPDINIPRRQALQAAVAQAVEEAVGSLVPLKIFVEKYDVIDKKILKDPKKYVESSTIIAEAREGDQYRVVAQAMVKLDVLRADLVILGLLLPESQMPKWMVVVPDRVGEETWRSKWIEGGGGSSTSEAALEDAVRGYGFRVAVMAPQGARLTESDKMALLQFVDALGSDRVAPAGVVAYAKLQGATHLLIGRGQVIKTEGINGPQFALGTAELRLVAIDVSTGKIIGELTKRAAVETLGNAGLDSRVIRMAARRADVDLVKTFDSVNPTGSAAGFPVISIDLTGVTDFNQFAAIRKFLENDVRGVRSVIISKLAPGEVQIEVRFAGVPQELVNELINHPFDNFTMRDDGSTEGRYRLLIK